MSSFSAPLPIAPGSRINAILPDLRVSERTADGPLVAEATRDGLALDRRHTLGADGALDVEVTVAATAVRERISIQQDVQLDLPWTSYVLAPGVMYNGNRFLVSTQPYCPYLPTEGVSPDGPIIVSAVPRLTSDTGYRAELAADALTTPILGLFDSQSGRGALVVVDIYGPWGVAGVTVCTSPSKPVVVTLALPVQRQRRYRFCDWTEANEPGMTLRPGDRFSARLRVIPVAAATIPAFLARFSAEAWARRHTRPRNFPISLEAAADLVEAKLDRHNWIESLGAYHSALQQPGAITGWLQIGWVGGGVTAVAMLQSPDAARRERARRMLDFLCTAQAPSGYFYGTYTADRGWLSFGGKRPGCRAFSLVRRPVELTRDLLKAAALVRARGEEPGAAWLPAARACLDAMVGTVRRFGHLGYTVDPETGDVLWGDSACGAFGIEPLVRGFLLFGDRACLATAERLAAYYREKFLARGFTCGGVGDALMAVDSESAYALLSGLVHLFDVTKNPIHLAWAREAADLFQTWVVLYDTQLPPDSPLGKLGIQPRGAVIANIQNQHGAAGICTNAGRELDRLSELTGDPRYAGLRREIVACQPQMVVRPDNADFWAPLPVGGMSERLMTMDGMAPAGHTDKGSTWSEIALLLAARDRA